jgi:hypothetical protein
VDDVLITICFELANADFLELRRLSGFTKRNTLLADFGDSRFGVEKVSEFTVIIPVRSAGQPYSPSEDLLGVVC